MHVSQIGIKLMFKCFWIPGDWFATEI